MKLKLMSILILGFCQICFLFYSKTTYAPKTTNVKQTGDIQGKTTVTFFNESTEQIQNENEKMILVATLVGVVILMFILCTLFFYSKFRKRKCDKGKLQHISNIC